MLEHVTEQKPSEIWVTEHHPVYTQGRLSLPEHFKAITDIPIIETDRGGQVTYHGPGQLIVYPILRLDDFRLSPRELVDLFENTTITLLSTLGIHAYADPKARGVYIHGEKIASIGLKIKQGYCYHGVAINLHCDLGPFLNIVPCGNDGMKMTNLSTHTKDYVNFSTQFVELFVENLEKIG